MDYQVFWIKISGGVFGRRWTTKALRVFESFISVSGVSPPYKNDAVEFLFENISNVLPSMKTEDELTLNVLNGNRCECLFISCESRTELITTLLNRMDDLNGIGTDFTLKKHSHQSEGLVETVFRVRSASVVKMVRNGLRYDPKVNPAKKINFSDILKVRTLTDDEQIVLMHLSSRVLKLSTGDVTAFLQAISRNMKFYLNRELQVEMIDTATMVDDMAFHLKRMRAVPSLFEFRVLKRSTRRGEERKRSLYISGEHFIEMTRDEVVVTHSMRDILGLVVNDKNANEVLVEFKTCRPAEYYVENRDEFVASVVDAATAAKASQFSVRPVSFLHHMLPEQRPAYQTEQERFFLSRLMSEFNGKKDPAILHITLKDFASNLDVGKSHCNDAKVVLHLAELLKEWISCQDYVRSTTCCIVISRLLGSSHCFESLKFMTDVVLVLLECMRADNALLAFAATVALQSAFKYSGETDVTTTKLEQTNRLVVLRSENMQQLATLLQTYTLKNGHALQAYGMVKLLTAGLENVSLDSEAMQSWMKAFESSIMALGDVLCVLSRSDMSILRESTAILLEAILAKCSPLVSSHFRSLSIKRCLIIVHMRNALFSTMDLSRSRSARLLFQMVEGNEESNKLLQRLLPKGAFDLHCFTANKMIQTGKEESKCNFCAWIMLLEVLRRDTIETPLFIWNDMKRAELREYLEEAMEGFIAAASSNHVVSFESADVKLQYSSQSEGEGTVVGNVHLELLVDHSPAADEPYPELWKIPDPSSLFQAVFQALLFGFTPLFGRNNIPEVDLRLGVHVLTWIYERYASDVTFSLQTSNVIEASVGMLQEVIDTQHQVFIFKLVAFLLTMMEVGGRENVLRFVRAGGANAVVTLLVSSLAECCSDKSLFEADGWNSKQSKTLETVEVVGHNGEVRLARVPSGKVNEALDKTSLNGSLDAKDAIKWQDSVVPCKIQFGLALNVLEALLRISGTGSYVESFPASGACLLLSSEELLCHLVQSLLRAKSPAFGRILTIISKLVRANKPATSQMHKLGAFDILLWKLLAGDITDSDRRMAVIFISQLNSLQVSDTTLTSYLPAGLVLKLSSEEPDAFLQLLDSEENDPEVIWTRRMRVTLVHHLSYQLEPFVRSRATDPMSLYVHTSATVFYEELEDAVYTPPYYLHNLLDSERFPNYSIGDSVQFLNNLMKDLRKVAADLKHSASRGMASSFWTQEVVKIGILVRTLAYLLDRFPKLSAPEDVEHVIITLATPAVHTGRMDDSLALDMILQATKVHKRACALSAADTSRGYVRFALSVLALGSQLTADGSLPEPLTGQLELGTAGAFLVLELACRSRPGRDLLRKDVRWCKGLWCALSAAAGDAASNVPTGPSPISFAALSCLKHFVVEEPLEVFKQGLHLPLLLLIFSPRSRHINGCKPALLLSATEVLRCLQDKDASLLKNIIPAPLLACLNDSEGPERFLTMQASDLTQPKALWNQSVREELRDRLNDRLRQHAAALEREGRALEDEIDWLRDFTYECLSNRLVIDGLFVEGIISCNRDHPIDFVPDVSLMKSMVDFLVRHSTVGLAEEDGGNGAVDFPGYISVFTALEELMVYALQMDMEQLLAEFEYDALASLVFKNKLDSRVQVRIASITKVLISRGMLETVTRSHLLEALTVLVWGATAEFSKEGMEEVLRHTLDALLTFSERLPATLTATNSFRLHATLLPLLALFCDVSFPVLRGSSSSSGPKSMSRCFDHRVTSARILGHLLLAAAGVSRRDQLLRDLQDTGNADVGRLDRATDMYELLSAVEHSSASEDSKLIRTLLLLFPLELLSLLARSPTEACRAYDGNFSTVTLVWDESRRHLVKSVLIKETARLRTIVNAKSTCQLPSWSLQSKQPVFLRWTLTLVGDDEKRPLYGQDHTDGYAQELFLGGFYVDQFLRYHTTSVVEPLKLERFLHELRTALTIGRSTDGLQEDAFDFNDRRRLLLGLLCLFNAHPNLLSSRSNIDITLPLYDILSTDSGPERRALAQPALVLLHSAVTHADIADCVVSEEFVYTLASFLTLNVPYGSAGRVGTDPRVCSLSLLLRLMRLSSNTVDIVLRLGVMSKLEDLVVEFEGSPAVQRKAAECLAVMCADKRKGCAVQAMLEKRVPCNLKGHGTWKLQVTKIQEEEILDEKLLRHFLQQLYPSPWWTTDSPEGRESTEENVVAVVEAGFSFSKARLSDFESEAEIVFVRSVACMAAVDLRSVKILRKRIAGRVVVDFEVSFRRQETMKKKLPEMNATLFKEKLQSGSAEVVFTNTFLESLGVARVTSVSLKQPELLRQQTSWKNGSSTPSLGDKTVIYVAKTQSTMKTLAVEDQDDTASALERATSPPVKTFSVSSQSPASTLSYPVPSGPSVPLPPGASQVPPPPPPPPPPPLPSSRVFTPSRSVSSSDKSTSSPETNGMNGTNGYITNVNGSNGYKNGYMNGCSNGSTDGPLHDIPESFTKTEAEDRRGVLLEEELKLLLQEADINEENQRLACSNFLEAFEDERGELGKMVEKYSKLIQKFPLKPQLCYDLMVAWEENCIDLMSEEELGKYGRSVAAFDICRLEDPELAVVEAKRKFQGILKSRREKEWKERSRQLKGDMSAELAKAVGERKEKVGAVDTVKDELKALTRGKIQKRKTVPNL